MVSPQPLTDKSRIVIAFCKFRMPQNIRSELESLHSSIAESVCMLSAPSAAYFLSDAQRGTRKGVAWRNRHGGKTTMPWYDPRTIRAGFHRTRKGFFCYYSRTTSLHSTSLTMQQHSRDRPHRAASTQVRLFARSIPILKTPLFLQNPISSSPTPQHSSLIHWPPPPPPTVIT